MGWPQWVVAAWMFSNVVLFIVQGCKDRSRSSTEVTIGVLLLVGIYAALAGALHAGGFW